MAMPPEQAQATRPLREEYSVALAPDHRADHAGGIRWVGRELEPGGWIHGGPLDGRACLEKGALEVLGFIAYVLTVEDTGPLHVERDLGHLGKTRGENTGQRALQIVIVKDLCRQPERGPAAAEMYFDALPGQRQRPKDAVRVGVRIVVVNLVRSNWTLEQIESNETERRLIVLAVLCDVDAVHETHIRLERERSDGARSGSANAIGPDEPVEVGDL